ncbi:PREDICTED: 5'-nucleotidase domain-containing protein 1 isoform X1 [Dinoponera quadriceps]|uniref:5'-nucleotidase domain-containing protein 1 isoform X1 n=1 Tax=Dinoponera quadriceps TaxID=609295 RepID=A0A6P3XFF0_DINQU|nr:PREDICTED: 5'-nucleotidase domain-containing protein 1 isoform X1 [Dinoponera quadriceps]
MIRYLRYSYCNTIKWCVNIHTSVHKQITSGAVLLTNITVHVKSYSSKVYCITEHNMSAFKLADYDCIGFDLDNTLVRYNIANLMHMEFNMLATFMVDNRRYSKKLLEPLTDNDLDFMQKGLLLDFERGNILKIGSDGVIHRACHGTHLLNKDQIQKIYSEQRWEVTDIFCNNVLDAWNGPLSEKVRSVLDYFDVPASLVFARAVDALDEEHESCQDKYNIWPDILDGMIYMFSIDHFESDKGIFGHIKQNPEKYLHKTDSTALISWLQQIKPKPVTFLLTGSNVDYVNFIANYALGEEWQFIFDIIVCYAKKPGFFTANRPFLDVIQNKNTDIISQQLERGKIYSEGNWKGLREFFRTMGKENPRCLYIGDNLVQDIYVPNAFAYCDTISVVEEIISEKHGYCTNLCSEQNLDEKMLNSKLWGSYFYLTDLKANVDTFWGHIIKKHSKLCISRVEEILTTAMDKPFPSFDNGGKS